MRKGDYRLSAHTMYNKGTQSYQALLRYGFRGGEKGVLCSLHTFVSLI